MTSARTRLHAAHSGDLTLAFPAAALTAAAESRTIRGQVIPYGVPGSTSAGRVRIKAGALALPADPREVILLDEHSDRGGRPAGVLASYEDGPEALTGAFRVARTPVGDQLLAEADPECPIKAGLSVELTDVEFDPATPDLVTAARLVRVATVPVPAFSTARATSVAAAHTPQEGTERVDLEQLLALIRGAQPEQLNQLHAALVPAARPEGGATSELRAPGGVPAGQNNGREPMTLQRLCELQASFSRGERSAELTAALSDVTYSANPATRAPEFAGELWSGSSYERQFVPLLDTSKALKSYKGTGWRWVVKPQLGDYAGDKAAVPSNAVSTEPADFTAERVAGAWDVDRAYVDFGDTEFWASFYAATTESYREQTDMKALDAIIAAAVAAETAPGAAAYVTAAHPDALRAMAVASAVLQNTPNVRQRPTFALLNTGDFLRLLDFTGLEVPAFLQLMGIDPAGFRHADAVPTGRIIAGCKNALQYRELGDVPIRVEAVDISKGGVDAGVFGYCATFEARPGGIVSLPITYPA